MDETVGTRFWCHMCSQIVSPVPEVEVKCPTCHSGFIEEVEASNTRDVNQGFNDDAPSEPAMSLWVPLMLGMMGGLRPVRRGIRVQLAPRSNGNDENQEQGEEGGDRESEMNDQRRRRSAAAILEMLHGIRNQMGAESQDSDDGNRERERERGREREHVILINPFNHTIIVQGSYNTGENHGDGEAPPIGALGDYFFGPSLDMLLQHLAENDPNRYGTPPAKKEAVEAMPAVKILDDSVQCSVCLEEFEIGAEAKEMPCKHRFHEGCILPWLELHSSCPVCRYQMPADESKMRSARRESDNPNDGSDQNTGEDGNSGSGVRFSIPWPFNALFSFRGATSAASDNGGNEGGDSHVA
uniref:RING-type E3 ubiquitin transferase n=1 Tax=Kalanchoe fedtschenkoi TaxID=63787 RepID=A0A7N0TJB3_KALFE